MPAQCRAKESARQEQADVQQITSAAATLASPFRLAVLTSIARSSLTTPPKSIRRGRPTPTRAEKRMTPVPKPATAAAVFVLVSARNYAGKLTAASAVWAMWTRTTITRTVSRPTFPANAYTLENSDARLVAG